MNQKWKAVRTLKAFTCSIYSSQTSDKVKEVDTGLQHCVTRLENGEVWVWGKGNRGQLGGGDVESGSTPTRVRLLKKRREGQGGIHGRASECRF